MQVARWETSDVGEGDQIDKREWEGRMVCGGGIVRRLWKRCWWWGSGCKWRRRGRAQANLQIENGGFGTRLQKRPKFKRPKNGPKQDGRKVWRAVLGEAVESVRIWEFLGARGAGTVRVWKHR